MVYHDRKGGENEWRKYQTSSITRDLWVWDRQADTHRQLTPPADRGPEPGPRARERRGRLLPERGQRVLQRAPHAVAGGESEQVTRFRGAPVRFLSAADDGTLAFGHDGLLYTLAPGAAEPRRVPVRIASDWMSNDERVIRSRGIGEFSVSPTGKEIAFTSRGEVFATSWRRPRPSASPTRPSGRGQRPLHPGQRRDHLRLGAGRPVGDLGGPPRAERGAVLLRLDPHRGTPGGGERPPELPAAPVPRRQTPRLHRGLSHAARPGPGVGDVVTLLTEEHIFGGASSSGAPTGVDALHLGGPRPRRPRHRRRAHRRLGRDPQPDPERLQRQRRPVDPGGRGHDLAEQPRRPPIAPATGSGEAMSTPCSSRRTPTTSSSLTKEELELRREMRGVAPDTADGLPSDAASDGDSASPLPSSTSRARASAGPASRSTPRRWGLPGLEGRRVPLLPGALRARTEPLVHEPPHPRDPAGAGPERELAPASPGGPARNGSSWWLTGAPRW
jgi:hypothetical protein